MLVRRNRARRVLLAAFAVVALVTSGVRAAEALSPYSISSVQDGTSFTTTFTNTSGYSGSYLFDIELWNSSNQRVYQQFETRSVSGTKTVAITKSIPALAAGTYTVRGGIFGANWTPKYLWNENVGTIVVSGTGPAYSIAATVGTTTFTTTFTSSQNYSGSYLFDIELWNSSNQRVYQQFETRSVSGTKTVAITKSIPALPAGKYSIRAGLFSPNWATKYLWISNAGSVTTGSSSTTTNTTAPSPSATYAISTMQGDGSFTTTFTSSQNYSGSYLFDIELWNSSNQRVYQQFETRSVSGTKTVAITKSIPALAAGTYTVRGGIFGANWTPNHAWSNSAGSVTVVGAGGTPGGGGSPSAPPPTGPSGNWSLAFGDEFNGASLDTTKWLTCSPQMAYRDGMCFGHSGERQVYRPSNVSIADYGNGSRGLRITGQNNNKTWGNTRPENVPYGSAQYDSGAISSGPNNFGLGSPGYQPFSYKYGYFEARIRVPKGQGYWPALWTFPTDNIGPWEIDNVEILGSNVNQADVSAHYPAGQTDAWIPTADLSAGFHTFGMDWQPDAVSWYYDGQLVRRVDANNMQISAKSHYLILNLAIGGNWPGPPDATTVFPGHLDIDWVRVWTKNVGQ